MQENKELGSFISHYVDNGMILYMEASKTLRLIKNLTEERTKAIVNVVVDSIIQYVKENEIVSSDISHILFIGDSFKNTMFKDALLQRYAVNNDNIINYQDKDLPEIVSIYNQMDLSQFDSLRTNIKNHKDITSR